MVRDVLACLLVVVVVGWIGPAWAEQRVALVIGNDSYATLPDLSNARADAKDMAARLSALDFEVILRLDAGRRDIYRARAAFEERLRRAEVGLVFYAGHGIQSQGVNWLIPADARVEIEEDLPAEGIDAQNLLSAMEYAGAEVNILILDACRDNPLPRRTRSAARGLRGLAVAPSVQGLVVLYSAAEGQTAQDGPPGENGVFTGALLDQLGNPGLTLEQVFKRTAARVVETTGGIQRPWFHGSLTGDFHFVPEGSTVVITPPGADSTLESLFWDTIKSSRDAADFEAYLKRFPRGVFADLARNRVAALRGGRIEKAIPDKTQVIRYETTQATTTGFGFVGGSACCGCDGKAYGALPSDFPLRQLTQATFGLRASRADSYYTRVKPGPTRLRLEIGQVLSVATSRREADRWSVTFAFDPPAVVQPGSTRWQISDGDDDIYSAVILQGTTKGGPGLSGTYEVFGRGCQYARQEPAWYSVDFEGR